DAAPPPAGSLLPAPVTHVPERLAEVHEPLNPPADTQDFPKEHPLASPKVASSFAVRVLPLQDESTDAVGRAAVQSLYDSFLQRLRTFPGLDVIEGNADASAASGRIDYQITINVAAE